MRSGGHCVKPHRPVFARLPCPKDQRWLTSRGQIDFYDDPALVSAAADRVVATFAHAT